MASKLHSKDFGMLSLLLILLPLVPDLGFSLFCRSSETLGVYQQCERVTLLSGFGNSSRIYSHALKKVRVEPKNSIYFAKENHDSPKPGTKIVLPGEDRFYKICEVKKSFVQCGIDEISISSIAAYFTILPSESSKK